MRRLHLLPMLAPMLLGLAMLASGCEEDGSSILVPSPDTTRGEGTTGAGLYRYHCSACHGLDGRPQIAASSDLRDYDSTFAHFDSVLTAGPGLMPRYPHLDSARRRLVYEHVRAFSR